MSAEAEPKPVAAGAPQEPAREEPAREEPTRSPVDAAMSSAPATPETVSKADDDGDRAVVEMAIERALDTVATELREVAQSEVAKISEGAGGYPDGASAPTPAPEATPEAAQAAIARLAAFAAEQRPVPAASSASPAPERATQPADPRAAASPANGESEAKLAGEATAVGGTVGQPLSQLLARMNPPASVEDLGRAMSASGGGTLDEMVEAIVRPAVRDWLENNLSTLAERIVREEIERVSRRGS